MQEPNGSSSRYEKIVPPLVTQTSGSMSTHPHPQTTVSPELEEPPPAAPRSIEERETVRPVAAATNAAPSIRSVSLPGRRGSMEGKLGRACRLAEIALPAVRPALCGALRWIVISRACLSVMDTAPHEHVGGCRNQNAASCQHHPSQRAEKQNHARRTPMTASNGANHGENGTSRNPQSEAEKPFRKESP